MPWPTFLTFTLKGSDDLLYELFLFENSLFYEKNSILKTVNRTDMGPSPLILDGIWYIQKCQGQGHRSLQTLT